MVGVYAIVHRDSGRRYIGSSLTIERRWRDHCRALNCARHKNQFLQRAWTKHSESAFEFAVLEETAIVDVRICEQRWLDATPNLFNANPRADVPPSQAGHSMSAENRARQSARFKTIQRTAEWCRRISEAKRGRRLDPEVRHRIAAANRLRAQAETQESKDRRASAMRAHWAARSPKERRVKHSQAWHAKQASAAMRSLKSRNSKRVWAWRHIRRQLEDFCRRAVQMSA